MEATNQETVSGTAAEVILNKGHLIKLSCTDCAHVRVCTVYRALADLLKRWTPETLPFEAENLAIICKEFISDSLVQNLRGNL